MGQYREWLRFREFNIKLHAQLRLLEEDIAQLQQQIGMYAHYEFPEENAVLLALAAHLDAQTHALSLQLDAPATSPSQFITAPSPEESVPTISPALRAQSELPHFDTLTPTNTLLETLDAPLPAPSPREQETPSAARPHEELTLLPQDMSAFLEGHHATEPQIELPWWLRNLIQSSLSGQGTRLVDPASLRTNRLVQRWSERWGRVTRPTTEHNRINYQNIPPQQEEQQ